MYLHLILFTNKQQWPAGYLTIQRQSITVWHWQLATFCVDTESPSVTRGQASRSLLMLLIKYRAKTGWHLSPCKQYEPIHPRYEHITGKHMRLYNESNTENCIFPLILSVQYHLCVGGLDSLYCTDWWDRCLCPRFFFYLWANCCAWVPCVNMPTFSTDYIQRGQGVKKDSDPWIEFHYASQIIWFKFQFHSTPHHEDHSSLKLWPSTYFKMYFFKDEFTNKLQLTSFIGSLLA